MIEKLPLIIEGSVFIPDNFGRVFGILSPQRHNFLSCFKFLQKKTKFISADGKQNSERMNEK
jgi:hypothetical protein